MSETKIIAEHTVDLDYSLIESALEEDRTTLEPEVILTPMEPVETHQTWDKCMAGSELTEMSFGLITTAAFMKCDLVERNMQGSKISKGYVCPLSEGSILTHNDMTVHEGRRSYEATSIASGRLPAGEIMYSEITIAGRYLGPCEAIESPAAP